MFYTPKTLIRATQYVIIYRNNKPVATMIFRDMRQYQIWKKSCTLGSRSVSLQLYNLVSRDLWAKVNRDWSSVPLMN